MHCAMHLILLLLLLLFHHILTILLLIKLLKLAATCLHANLLSGRSKNLEIGPLLDVSIVGIILMSEAYEYTILLIHESNLCSASNIALYSNTTFGAIEINIQVEVIRAKLSTWAHIFFDSEKQSFVLDLHI